MQSSDKVRLLVVDDSKFTRQVYKRVFRDDPVIEVVGEARNGREAIEMNLELEPDVITLDIDMPEMGGLEALEKIMASRPVPVLMVSSHTREQSELAFLALEKGAVDFVDKTSVDNTFDLGKLGEILRDKLVAVSQVTSLTGANEYFAVQIEPKAPVQEAPARLIVIGASTGGPPLVQRLIKAVPPRSRDAVVIVQHMPKGFTTSFAARLSRMAQVPVQEIEGITRVLAGHAYVARAGWLLEFRRDDDGCPLAVPRSDVGEYRFRPSIDLAMETAACYGPRTVGVILTGMGDDGADGMAAIEHAGGAVFVQDPSTAVLPSMPSSAIRNLRRATIGDIAALEYRVFAQSEASLG